MKYIVDPASWTNPRQAVDEGRVIGLKFGSDEISDAWDQLPWAVRGAISSSISDGNGKAHIGPWFGLADVHKPSKRLRQLAVDFLKLLETAAALDEYHRTGGGMARWELLNQACESLGTEEGRRIETFEAAARAHLLERIQGMSQEWEKRAASWSVNQDRWEEWLRGEPRNMPLEWWRACLEQASPTMNSQIIRKLEAPLVELVTGANGAEAQALWNDPQWWTHVFDDRILTPLQQVQEIRGNTSATKQSDDLRVLLAEGKASKAAYTGARAADRGRSFHEAWMDGIDDWDEARREIDAVRRQDPESVTNPKAVVWGIAAHRQTVPEDVLETICRSKDANILMAAARRADLGANARKSFSDNGASTVVRWAMVSGPSGGIEDLRKMIEDLPTAIHSCASEMRPKWKGEGGWLLEQAASEGVNLQGVQRILHYWAGDVQPDHLVALAASPVPEVRNWAREQFVRRRSEAREEARQKNADRRNSPP